MNTLIKHLKQGSCAIVLLGIVFEFIACSKNRPSDDSAPFLTISNGHFDVDAVILEGGTDKSGVALGSGSMSFTYTGDISGSFSAEGTLVSYQSDSAGIGATITLFENTNLERFEEGLTLIGFHPTGNGKTDVLVIGTKFDVFFPSIDTGDAFGIGPADPFNGLFLTGIKMEDFWDTETNKYQVSEKAFTIEVGVLQIVFRDSLHLNGTFFGTTDVDRTTLSEPYLVK